MDYRSVRFLIPNNVCVGISNKSFNGADRIEYFNNEYENITEGDFETYTNSLLLH